MSKLILFFNYFSEIEDYVNFTNESGWWEIVVDKLIVYDSEKSLILMTSGYSDSCIITKSNTFYLVHFTFNPKNLGEYEIEGQFSTPEEVWEKVIKPDIDRYYE